LIVKGLNGSLGDDVEVEIEDDVGVDKKSEKSRNL
jgi:hypothetical protein